MMRHPVITVCYDAPAINKKEILRYAGVRENVPQIADLLDECVSEIEGRLTYKVCYAEFPISIRDNTVDLSFAAIDSVDLKKSLKKCNRAVVFGATVGIVIDRLIAKYGITSPAKALMLQAIGAERIEALCECFCNDFSNKLEVRGKALNPRFSPGYGDLPLSFQKEVFTVLDCAKNIGLTLNGSLLMSPSKSVTAIAGIVDKKECVAAQGCNSCSKADCGYRRK